MIDLLICQAVGAGNAVLIRHRGPTGIVYCDMRDRRRAYVHVRAVRGLPDISGIERAVAKLRDVWGPVPVQDNSGVCSHLAA
jgi:hypothetical protein